MAGDIMTARETAAAVRAGQASAVEITKAALDRIGALDKDLGAFLAVDEAGALAAAEAVDQKVAAGEDPGPLAGVPVAVKDNLSTKGLATTAGSNILKGYIPPYDATAVARLRAAGAVIVGKTNMDEMGMGATTVNSAFQATKNPWDLDRVPGGSSGGSAAAVAARLVPLSLGSDTGGSVRQPAAMCGITGLRPTYGRVSRYGLLALAGSMDTVGLLALDARDCALALQVVAGPDDRDASAEAEPVGDWAGMAGEAGPKGLDGLRIGLPRQLFQEPVDPAVKAAVREALDQLAGMGAQVEECDLPALTYSLGVYYVLVSAEASSTMSRYDGVRFGLRLGDQQGVAALYEQSRGAGLGPEVKRRILLGTHLLSGDQYESYYMQALRLRRVIKEELEQALSRYDLLAAPAAPTTAFPFDSWRAGTRAVYRGDFVALPASLAGIPALSIPCGFVEGMPVGLQLMGRAYGEETLLRAALAYQEAFDHHRRLPPVNAAGAGAPTAGTAGDGGSHGGGEGQ
ncbi:MAG TPA: Asp-tRNA(Asn)/Glu-tRNA(Gln) amidotransferase subunit GatA [Sphingobacteriaceae bacterium]|nr:Asp-tRNA(Asn)/Glu-tRNA(Gln) amidotransferase subunit GatA [Sphingobacteriaceae bacterium]